MAQLDLLGYQAIAVNHYDRKAAPVAGSIEQAADTAAGAFRKRSNYNRLVLRRSSLHQRNRRGHLLHKN